MRNLKFAFRVMFIFFAIVALICPCILYAQDSTSAAVSGGGVSGLPSWAYTASMIAVGVYELVIRYIPTAKSYSLVGLAIKIIQTIVPNNNSSTPTQPHA